MTNFLLLTLYWGFFCLPLNYNLTDLFCLYPCNVTYVKFTRYVVDFDTLTFLFKLFITPLYVTYWII